MKYINPYKMFYGCIVPNWLAERTEIGGIPKLVYGRLMQYAGKSGVAFPRQSILAEAVGIKRRQVIRHVQTLVENGLLQVEQVGLKKANRYHFLHHTWMDGSVESDTSEVSQPALPIVSESVEVNHSPSSLSTKKKGVGVARPAKEKKPTNPNHAPFRDAFLAGWRTLYGSAYPYQFGRDDRHVSEVLKALENDMARALRALAAYFSDSREFLTEEVRHSLSTFAGSLPRYVTQGPPRQQESAPTLTQKIGQATVY